VKCKVVPEGTVTVASRTDTKLSPHGARYALNKMSAHCYTCGDQFISSEEHSFD